MKTDAESICDTVVTILKANLNTKLTAITTEKADSISLTSVDAAAYFFQTLNEKVVNLDPYIFYGVDSIEAVGIGPGVSETMTIVVWLVKEDDAEDANIQRRMLRYSRAIKEVCTEKWDAISKTGKVKIQAFAPVQFQEGINSSNPARVAMVSITVSMG